MKDELKHDMHKDPAELEREADRARANVEHTLEALERRFSPGEMVDQAMRLVRTNGGDFGRNLSTQVRNNPLPAVLAGIGITWLMAASNRPPPVSTATSTGSSLGSRASSAASSARGAAGYAGDSARSAAQGARSAAAGAARSVSESARGALGSTREAMGSVAGAGRHTAQSMAHATRTGAENLAHGFDYLRREQPLVLGVMAVAAGALIGAMFPSTRAEDEWLGEHSDEAARKLKEQARQKAEEAKSAAADAVEAARGGAEATQAGAQGGPGATGSSSPTAPI